MEREAKQSGHRTALVLQGGGALAAYELGVVERLYRDGDFEPDLIAGVSMGAIHGAVLAAAKSEPLAALDELWRRLRPRVPPGTPPLWRRWAGLLGIPDFFSHRLDFWNAPFWTGYYDMRPFRRLLERLIDFPRLYRGRPRLLVTATDVRRGSVRVFDSDQEEITAAHLLASSALPPVFPPVAVNGGLYWDGGVADNAPLAPVIDLLDHDPACPPRIIAVKLVPEQGFTPNNLLEVHDRIFEIIFHNRIQFDYGRVGQINELAETLSLIEADLPSTSAARQSPGFRRLEQYKLIEDVVFITNSRDDIAFGPFDFSDQTIRLRRDAGYEDADRVIGELGSRWRGAAASPSPQKVG